MYNSSYCWTVCVSLLCSVALYVAYFFCYASFIFCISDKSVVLDNCAFLVYQSLFHIFTIITITSYGYRVRNRYLFSPLQLIQAMLLKVYKISKQRITSLFIASDHFVRRRVVLGFVIIGSQFDEAIQRLQLNPAYSCIHFFLE